jgi:hypothetical protein
MMKCHTCRNEILPGEDAERINPPPWHELIVCGHCYEFKAWLLVSQEQIQEALDEDEESGLYIHGRDWH